ncbi:MAG: lipid-A-disaccharide synthase, partial [Acidobacteriota bacterium]|nr:lipid-A-disaccharide synthase [Acidobacteriota bacterium]
MPTPIKIMIIAGEDSGDSHAAGLVRGLRHELGDSAIEFFGAAGRKMREAGVEALVESDEFGIVGVPEVVRAVPMFLGVMNKLTKAAVERKPDLVVLVDFPEFNLKIAKRFKKKGFRVVYYISPQVWAWRSYRVRGIRKYVDLLLTILPFESDWYRRRGVRHTRFVGHPLTGTVRPKQDKASFCAEYGFDAGSPLVALLPGSRRREIDKILPEMLLAAKRLNELRSEVQFGLGLAGSRSPENVTDLIKATLGVDWQTVKLIKKDT